MKNFLLIADCGFTLLTIFFITQRATVGAAKKTTPPKQANPTYTYKIIENANHTYG